MLYEFLKNTRHVQVLSRRQLQKFNKYASRYENCILLIVASEWHVKIGQILNVVR